MYSSDALLQSMDGALESALWAAIRGLEERADLADEMSGAAAPTEAETLRADAGAARENAELIRRLLVPSWAGDEGSDSAEESA